jgi:hypothetical protein
MLLPIYRRPHHDGIPFTSSVEETLDLLHKSRRASGGNVTIVSGVEMIKLSSFRRITTYLHSNVMSIVTEVRQTEMFRSVIMLSNSVC